MQKCTESQSIKTMQLETTIRFHFILVAINKTIRDNKYWWGAQERGVLKHHYVNEIIEVLIEVRNWGFSKNKSRTILWYIFIATGHLSKHNMEIPKHLCM